MKICVLSPSFPTSKTIDFVFVDQLCRAFADLGHQVTVIAPQSLTKCLMRHIPIAKRHGFYRTAKGNTIELFRPYAVSFGNTGIKLFRNSTRKAVNRAFHRLKTKPDVCYGHFWSSIFALYPLAKEVAVPLCGASGEENVGYYVHSSEEYKKKVRDYLSGVISVSSKNQQECLSLGLVSPEKSIVVPNAIDQTLFRKLDKDECRHKLGLSKDVFIVSFVGQFVPRKGTLRLNEALKKLDDPKLKAVFIGTGSEDPDYAGIVQKGRVAHDDVPVWLNAADVFVLPTENEGCCNAIIEAMACGLPIISTDAPFNHDILNDGNSIMVGCHDVDAIASAIRRLKEDDGLRQRLSEGALATARGLSINQRAQRIIDFMQKQIKQ
ncbi:MAG: glycosyltransferase family 4 protein [Bacteroidales bacterium]|nr:glycosyltransferase family 4 protein [Bacteroidales bacterium]